jgi:hypothetical protein
MIWVLGYPGSGTKFVAQVVQHALGIDGELAHGIEEPHVQMSGWKEIPKGDYDDSYALHDAKFMRGFLEKHGHRPVCKEEFAVPYVMNFLAGTEHKTVYIQRDTLANVEFLLSWKPIMGWLWYFESIVAAEPEAAQDMWPEDAPSDSVPCILAIAHELQLKHDLHTAKVCNVPVFKYETLCADYGTEWPRLFHKLGVSFTVDVQEEVRVRAFQPRTTFCVDEQLFAWVEEIERKASHDGHR